MPVAHHSISIKEASDGKQAEGSWSCGASYVDRFSAGTAGYSGNL
jgi:hypothetical protein